MCVAARSGFRCKQECGLAFHVKFSLFFCTVTTNEKDTLGQTMFSIEQRAMRWRAWLRKVGRRYRLGRLLRRRYSRCRSLLGAAPSASV